MHTVTVYLVCDGAAQAIDFYKKAFDAVEMFRLPGADGKLLHGHIRIGDSNIMLADEHPNWGAFGPKTLRGTPVSMYLYVEDAEAAAARAVAAGAKLVMPVMDMFYGDRCGQVEDPFGHRWSIATRVKNLTADEVRNAVPNMTGECAAPRQP
jgi:uncharacterized glyoxalase superfamily protein PhnB